MTPKYRDPEQQAEIDAEHYSTCRMLGIDPHDTETEDFEGDFDGDPGENDDDEIECDE